MSDRQDIDAILRHWPFEPGVVSARLVHTGDGRDVLQMRIEMGILQMETTGRPDGERPHAAETYLDALIQEGFSKGESFVLTDDQCFEVDREFLQFYNRRICYLALRKFHPAVDDADHTLALMDFVAKHSPEDEWTLSHEQYRPFVYYHRVQAAAMAALQETGAEAAIEQLNDGLKRMREIFESMGAADRFDQDELVAQLAELKESLRKEYDVGNTLTEQLAAAISNEEYERAARLRDEIARRGGEK